MKLHERLMRILVNPIQKWRFPIKKVGTIVQIESIAPDLKKLYIQSDFKKLPIHPGDSLQLGIGVSHFRNYTIAGFDKETEICEILVYNYGSHPLGAWLQNCSCGDTVVLKIKQGRPLSLRFNPVFKQHFLFGDESSLGILQFIKSQADLYNHSCLCLMELDQQHKYWPDLLSLGETMVVDKSIENPGQQAIDQIKLPGKVFKKRWSEAAFYLSGGSGSTLALQKALYALGIPAKNIQIQPYWVDAERSKWPEECPILKTLTNLGK